MNKQIGDIIFDLDGTLWDSSENVAASWTQTVRAVHHPMLREFSLSQEDMRSLMGLTMDEIAGRIFPNLSPSMQNELMEKCCQEEQNYLAANGAELYDNESQVLHELSRSHRLFIVSNCQNGYIESFFEFTGYERYFTDYLCYGDTGKQKSFTIKRLIEKNRCYGAVYVGDTRGDYLSTVTAQIPFIFASYGFGKLMPADTPFAVIDSFEGILNI